MRVMIFTRVAHFARSTIPEVACEQAHSVGYSCEYLGGLGSRQRVKQAGEKNGANFSSSILLAGSLLSPTRKSQVIPEKNEGLLVV